MMNFLFPRTPPELPPRPDLRRTTAQDEAKRQMTLLRLRGYSSAEIEEVANLLGRAAHLAGRAQG